MNIIVSIAGLAVVGLLAFDAFGMLPQAEEVIEPETETVETEEEATEEAAVVDEMSSL